MKTLDAFGHGFAEWSRKIAGERQKVRLSILGKPVKWVVCQEEPLLSLSAYPQQKILCSLLAGPITHIEAPMLAPRVFWLPRLPKPCSYLLSSKPARTHPHSPPPLHPAPDLWWSELIDVIILRYQTPNHQKGKCHWHCPKWQPGLSSGWTLTG